MRKIIFTVVALGLASCATNPSQPAPYVIDITDQSALDQDKIDCEGAALGYKAPLSATQIGASAAKGAANNAAGAAVNPLVPVLGAAGAATSTTLDELGVLNTKQRRVYLLCLAHRGAKSGAYNVIDPDQ